MKIRCKKAIKIIAVLLAINTVFVFTVGAVIFTVALKRDYTLVRGEDENWLTREGEDLYITSDDGVRLHGYYVQNPDSDGRYAIICHGYSADGAGMSGYANKFYRMGYSVFAPDARCHGRSEGGLIGMGYIEKRDIIQWINLITKDTADARVVIFGVSMGGATSLFTSGEADLPSTVKAIISDCAYTDVYEQIGSAIKYSLPWVPFFPVVDCASAVCQLFGGYDLKKASCVEAVKKSNTPTLFIHGSEDTYVPFAMLDTLYENAACEKERLVIEGAEHAASERTDKALYWSSIEAFLDKYV